MALGLLAAARGLIEGRQGSRLFAAERDRRLAREEEERAQRERATQAQDVALLQRLLTDPQLSAMLPGAPNAPTAGPVAELAPALGATFDQGVAARRLMAHTELARDDPEAVGPFDPSVDYEELLRKERDVLARARRYLTAGVARTEDEAELLARDNVDVEARERERETFQARRMANALELARAKLQLQGALSGTSLPPGVAKAQGDATKRRADWFTKRVNELMAGQTNARTGVATPGLSAEAARAQAEREAFTLFPRVKDPRFADVAGGGGGGALARAARPAVEARVQPVTVRTPAQQAAMAAEMIRAGQGTLEQALASRMSPEAKRLLVELMGEEARP